jgi:predicted metal-dependent hydrolase
MKFDCEVIRSDRRSVGIKIKDGKVTVRAPRYVTDREIEKILKKHEKWIEEKLSLMPEKEEEKLTE